MYLVIHILLLIVFIAPPVFAQENIDCNNASTTLDVLYCGMEEFKILEKDRENLEGKVIQKAKQFDKVLIEEGREEFADNEYMSIKSKKAFEKYRDIECARQEIHAGVGSIRRVVGRFCVNKLTQERINLLQQYQFERP